jgi:membrane protease YdiL (CAAX protease family)
MDTSQSASTMSREELSQLAVQMYQNGAQGTIVRANELLIQSKRVCRWLATVAITQTVLAFGLGLALSVPQRPVLLPVLKIGAMTACLQTVLFWLLYGWSQSAPLAPAIAGLIVHVTTWSASFTFTFAYLERKLGEQGALAAMPLTPATLIRWVVMIGLVRAVIAGVRHRKLMARLEQHQSPAEAVLPSPQQAGRRRFAGVATSIGLYCLLLMMSLNMIVTWGDGTLTPALYRGFVWADAIIVLAWSIASWRDVYRLLLRDISPMWYLGAIGLGCITFLIVTAWSSLVRSWIGVAQGDLPSAPLLDHWYMPLLLTAVTPAIIEEIAFRGIIFGGLARVLRDHEVIIVSALMFMALHLNPIRMPDLLLAGLILGFMRYKSGSWLPGIFMHFTHNFLVLLQSGGG